MEYDFEVSALEDTIESNNKRIDSSQNEEDKLSSEDEDNFSSDKWKSLNVNSSDIKLNINGPLFQMKHEF